MSGYVKMAGGKPRVLYFDIAGRAFGIRICLFKAFGKDGWIDDRIKSGTWLDVKPSTPLGSVPTLFLPDGRQIAQSEAILRWAGKKAGLYPTNEEDALVVDEVLATANECASAAPQGKPGDELKQKREEFSKGYLMKGMTLMESRMQEPFVLGEDLSIADFYVYWLVNMISGGRLDYIDAIFVDQFPKLKKHLETVKETELLKSYSAQYPN